MEYCRSIYQHKINVVLLPFPLCAENCLDRHVEEDPNRVALIWEKDEPRQHENITYKYETDEYPSFFCFLFIFFKAYDWACMLDISGHSKIDILKKHADM